MYSSQTLPIFFSTIMSSSSSSTTTSTSDKIFLLKSESSASNTSETLSAAQQQEAEAESCEIIIQKAVELKKLQKIKVKPEDQKEDEDEDGFRTPTSLDHKIPEAKQCPAPPRKPKPSLKRKADYYYYSHHTSSSSSSPSSSSSCRRNPPLDLSIEVELLLYQTQHNKHLSSDSHKNPKKSRTHEFEEFWNEYTLFQGACSCCIFWW